MIAARHDVNISLDKIVVTDQGVCERHGIRAAASNFDEFEEIEKKLEDQTCFDEMARRKFLFDILLVENVARTCAKTLYCLCILNTFFYAQSSINLQSSIAASGGNPPYNYCRIR